MTIRDEEILNASTVYHEDQFHCDGWNYDFIEGAKWADQHPREGLCDGENFIKRAVEWISNYFEQYYTVPFQDAQSLISSMKGE